MRKQSQNSTVAGVDVCTALASLPALIDAVRTAMDMDPKWEDDRTETDALLAGLEPILTKAVRSDDPEYVGYCARQGQVLLSHLREVFPSACQDIPRAERAMGSIDDMQRMLGARLAVQDGAQSAGSIRPATEKQDWREQTLGMLQEVEGALDGASHIRPDDCPYTIVLMRLARDVVIKIDDEVTAGTVNREDVLNQTLTLEALLTGAKEVTATPAATRMLMAEALRLVEATSRECLDVIEAE